MLGGVPAVVTVLVAVALAWLIKKVMKQIRIIKMMEKIDGPKSHPIFGQLLDLMVPPEEVFLVVMSFCSSSRAMTRVWLTKFLPYVLLHKASSVETVLSSNKVITKSTDYDFFLPWLGRGLLTSTGRKWFGRRKMVTPAFHFKILEDFVEVFNQKSEVLVEKLSKKANGEVFDIFNIVTLCALDIILETAMGLSLQVQLQSDTSYVKAVQRMSGILQDRQKKPWLHPDWLFRLLGPGKEHDECLRVMHHLSLSTISDRRQLYRKKEKADKDCEEVLGKKQRLPFLDLLLKYSEDGEGLTDEEIREEVDTFMFEGHDTTATSINMTLYLLGRNPEIQSRVHEELDSVLGCGSNEVISSDMLKELRYLECCIKESLRMFPSVPIFGRLAQEDITIEGKVIPAGTQLLVFCYLLHRDPDEFKDPDEFDPDRFLPEQVVGRHPYAYVPFSAGPRNCIGQKFALLEEKVVLASVLRRFRVESVDDVASLGIMGEIILRPKNGLKVRLWPREERLV